MEAEANAKKTSIEWMAAELREQKTGDWFVAFWIISSTLALVSFIFSGLISALVILSGSWAISSYLQYVDTHKTRRYALTLKGVKIDGLLFPYKNISRFNILKHKDMDVLILDINSVLMPDVVIPIFDVNVDDVYFYISQFVEEDPEMQVPLSHIIAERLGL